MQSSLGNSSQKDLASEIKMLLKWLVLPDFDSFHKINILIFTQNKQCLQSNEKRDFFFFLMNQTTDVKTPRDSVTLKAYKSGSRSSSRV